MGQLQLEAAPLILILSSIAHGVGVDVVTTPIASLPCHNPLPDTQSKTA